MRQRVWANLSVTVRWDRSTAPFACGRYGRVYGVIGLRVAVPLCRRLGRRVEVMCSMVVILVR